MLHADIAGTTGQKTVSTVSPDTRCYTWTSRKHGNLCRLKDKFFKNRVFREHTFVHTSFINLCSDRKKRHIKSIQKPTI